MRIDYTSDTNGIIIVDINGTVNTLPYFNGKDLLRLIKSCGANDIQIVDFNKRCTYVIMDDEDFDRVESDYSE